MSPLGLLLIKLAGFLLGPALSIGLILLLGGCASWTCGPTHERPGITCEVKR